LPGLLHAAFVRSPYAHARITGLHLEEARALPGVVAVLGPAELPALGRPMPVIMPQPGMHVHTATPLARDVARCVGEAVAVVVADDPYRAADAAEAVAVAYEPMPAVGDPQRAGEEDAPVVHDDVPGTLAGHLERSAAA